MIEVRSISSLPSPLPVHPCPSRRLPLEEIAGRSWRRRSPIEQSESATSGPSRTPARAVALRRAPSITMCTSSSTFVRPASRRGRGEEDKRSINETSDRRTSWGRTITGSCRRNVIGTVSEILVSARHQSCRGSGCRPISNLSPTTVQPLNHESPQERARPFRMVGAATVAVASSSCRRHQGLCRLG